MSDYQVRKDIDRLERQLDETKNELEGNRESDYNKLLEYYNNVQQDIGELNVDKIRLLGLGFPIFNITSDGDLMVDLPSGMSNIFTINNNGDLISTNNHYSIVDGEMVYND